MDKVLILGSGGLSIGQAGEFDYSGSQAIKALKEEGIRTILINPNIATIQTSWNMADRVYFLPVNPHFVKKVIEKERPDGIILSFGGQTALNCGIDLFKSGVLDKFGVRVLGTPVGSVIITEDKGLFADDLRRIDVKTPRSRTVHTVDEALIAAGEIGFPLIVRSGFALGGLGSGFCEEKEELRELAKKALSYSSQILVEESLRGWKEIEYEVVRDSKDNCMTVCNMENFDPLGIHTGESIVVAPSQTLTDHEYQMLRRISIDLVKHFRIVGECNVQFALDPESDDYRVIEINARLSRSSALASKATGYPLAFIAAKLIIGKSLIEIPNPITKVTKAFFEPALDYIVVKFPRWDHEKFRHVKKQIGSSMKSVGEVMAIGRKFEEALQKSIRMVNPRLAGLTDNNMIFPNLDDELRNPTDKRVFAIMQALKDGYTIDMLYSITRIDKWFLHKMKNILDIESELKKERIDTIGSSLLRKAKEHGFSDKEIAKICGSMEKKVRSIRKRMGIIPVIKRIDTLAAEYPAKTNYLYLTYNGTEDDLKVEDKGVIVLGGGAYSIGSSVEFDWCCVECVKTLRQKGIPAVVINYNPETVSTDYDECDRLYFDELSLERVLDIHDKEHERGMIVSVGGQIPNNLALPLERAGVVILGTPPSVIDLVEDRDKFSQVLDELGLDQPEWTRAKDLDELRAFCGRVGYPILIRPSYVLSGRAMSVAYSYEDIVDLLKRAKDLSKDHPIVLSKFIEGAKEIDMDIVAKDGEIKLYAISEHVENAGVHSGDATLVTPPQKLYLESIRRIKRISRKLISCLKVTGPVNIQFLAKENKIRIIECNLRASRSFPFVSKVYNLNFIDAATRAILGEEIEKAGNLAFELDYLGVKAPQFSFTRLMGADPVLGVEMASTGEVACLGESLEEAFQKALISTGFSLPEKSILLSTGDTPKKAEVLEQVRGLSGKGFSLYGTKGTAEFYRRAGIDVKVLHWPDEKKSPNIMDYIRERKIELVVNIPKSNERSELDNDYQIRRAAADFGIGLITNIKCAKLFFEGLLAGEDLSVKAWDEYINPDSGK